MQWKTVKMKLLELPVKGQHNGLVMPNTVCDRYSIAVSVLLSKSQGCQPETEGVYKL